jgi:PAS domain S-box-containing protein
MPSKKKKPKTSSKEPSSAGNKKGVKSSLSTKILAAEKKIQKLQEQHRQLLDALDCAEMGIWEWNLKTNKLHWSEETFKLFGVTDKKITFESYLNILHPEDKAWVVRTIQESVAQSTNYYIEHRIVKSDGTVRWIHGAGNTFFDKNNNPVRMTGTVQDITAKKTLEFEREDWKKRHELISQSAGVVIYDYEIASGNIVWSGNIKEVLGYSDVEMGNIDTWADFIHPDDRQDAFALLERAQAKLKPYDVYYRFRTKAQGYCYLHDRGMFIPDANGKASRMLGMMHDVSERVAAEVAIRESEASFRGLFDTVGEAIYIQNRDSTFIDVNIYACEMYGYEKKEFIGNTPAFLSAEGRNEFDLINELIDKALNGKPQSFEWWGKKKDGTIFLKEVRLTKGTYFGKEVIIATAWDITMRKQAEEALRESEQRFRNLISDLNIGIILQSSASKILLMNKQAIQLISKEIDIIGKTLADTGLEFIQENGSTFDAENFPSNQAIRTKRPVRGVVIGVRKSKQDNIWLLVNAEPILSEAGNLKEVISTFTDISERKKAEEELKESEQRFRTLQQASFGGIGVHNMGVILDCNQGLSDITGYSYDELIGMNGLNLITEEYRGLVRERISTGYGRPYDVEGIRKDGSRYALEVQGKNIPYNNTTIRVTEFRDITTRKLTEQKILEQNTRLIAMTEDLKHKNEQLEEFTQIVSHNLRSPVGNIVTLLGFFENAQNDSEKNEYLHFLKESSESTLNALNDLHDVLQVKQNKNIEKQHVEFKKVFDQVKGMLSAKITETGAEIITDFSESPHIEYPTIYLESILLNLLSNSLKYYRPDVPPIIRVVTSKENNNTILSFSDNGLGINLERYGHQIFKMRKTFHKHPESRGIGLFMIKNQIEALGGEITVVSGENNGTTFKVDFSKNAAHVK